MVSMKAARIAAAILVILFAVGCASLRSACREGDTVALSAVPQIVTDAASSVVKGFTTTRASVEKEKDRTTYQLIGKAADGTEYKMEITAEGKVIEFKEKRSHCGEKDAK